MNNLKIIRIIARIIIIITVFLVGLYLGSQKILAPEWFNLTNKSESLVPAKTVLSFDFGNNEIKVFEDLTIQGKTSVFELLKQVATQNDLSLSYQDYGGEMGVFIKSINGKENNFKTGQFWQFWVNGEYANIGASNYWLKPGDKIEWRYTNSQN